MIIIDANENNPQSKLPEIQGVIVSGLLERVTGADIMITTSSFPVKTEKLILKHVESGALLIQRKSGMDLIASLGEHINSSLERMRKTGAFQSQCVLLFTGTLTCDKAGMAVIDGMLTDRRYISVIGAISSWQDRGGVYIQLECDELIPQYLSLRERKLLEYTDKKTKYVFPNQEAVYQYLEKVDDWRSTVITFPFIGEKRVNLLRQHMLDNNLGDDLLQAMDCLTNTKYPMSGGIGDAIRQATRSWIGLPDGYNLDIKYGDNE